MSIDKCNNCGICKSHCPIFKATGSEARSARGRALLARENFVEEAFYKCTLCGLCKVVCPLDCDLPAAIIKMRKHLALQGTIPFPVKKLIENIKKRDTPFV